MSLILLFKSKRGAIISSDKRVIDFYPASKSDNLEEELYNGDIKTDYELKKRAEELGVNISIRDNKKKITSKGGVLIGQVTSFEQRELKLRRVYSVPGYYLIIDVVKGKVERTEEDGSAFVILGNKITKREAYATIKREWSGKADMVEIEEVIKKAMENCSNKTASVSKEYDMLVSAESVGKERVMELLREDAEKNHWTVEEVF
jgi:hypothetical protein